MGAWPGSLLLLITASSCENYRSRFALRYLYDVFVQHIGVSRGSCVLVDGVCTFVYLLYSSIRHYFLSGNMAASDSLLRKLHT